MLLLIISGVIYERQKFVVLFSAAVLALSLISLLTPYTLVSRAEAMHFIAWFVVYLFFVGILFYIYADKIVLNKFIFIICGIMYFSLIIVNVSILDLLAGIFLAYCVVYMGMTRYSAFEKHVKGDYSYGIYLYGAPITQAVVAIVHSSSSPLYTPSNLAIITVLSLITTIGFSYGSWQFIEKHALRMKNLGRNKYLE
jgi:peptidoglycan/LPS O-acetylase OafA/YrhL